MRSSHELLHSRTRIRQRYAMFPLEGFPLSRLPDWKKTEARVLCSPAMGAGFVQYLLDISEGGGANFSSDDGTETFFFVMSGEVTITQIGGSKETLVAGGFALLPATVRFSIVANQSSRVIMLRKRYEPLAGIEHTAEFGNEKDIRPEPFMNNPHARLQLLIPDELQHDLAMNIFTFDPGHCLPYVETHVMEHGLLFLQGKGMYYLDDMWMEVQKDDFIWMGPYCPQSFYATGVEPARYIYYKNVNREIPL